MFYYLLTFLITETFSLFQCFTSGSFCFFTRSDHFQTDSGTPCETIRFVTQTERESELTIPRLQRDLFDGMFVENSCEKNNEICIFYLYTH